MIADLADALHCHGEAHEVAALELELDRGTHAEEHAEGGLGCGVAAGSAAALLAPADIARVPCEHFNVRFCDADVFGSDVASAKAVDGAREGAEKLLSLV